MNMPASVRRAIWSELVVLTRTFAARPRNWLALARNLIPVIGIYLLGWSRILTVFGYWFEGACMVALIVATFCIRVPEEKFRSARWSRVPLLLLATLLCGAFALFLVGIPYWMAYSVLKLGVAVDEMRRNHAVAFSFLCMFAGILVKAFQRGGYLTLTNEELKTRWEPDMHNLGARALAMVVISGWSIAFMLVPLIALLLTG
jgi:hypothetical protein